MWVRQGIAFVAYVAAAVVSSAETEVFAGDGQNGSGPAIGVGVSTLGITGEMSIRTVGNFVIRVNGNWADVGYDRTISGNAFSGSAKVVGAGLIADWHAFDNGFRLSLGGRYIDASFTGSISGRDITVNNQIYTAAQYGGLVAKVENGNKIAPYVGIGWDSSHFSSSGFSLGFEVGALYVGDPKATLTTTRSVAGLQVDLDAEVAKVKADYGKFGQIWPVVGLTAKYRF